MYHHMAIIKYFLKYIIRQKKIMSKNTTICKIVCFLTLFELKYFKYKKIALYY